MKQRITFLIPKSAPFINPESLEYDGTTLKLNNVEAWRQDRWTVKMDEIPEILRDTIKNLDGLEARWQSKEGGERVNPFAGGTTPGAHFFVPAREGEEEEEWMRLLCLSIKMASLKKAVCNGLQSFVKVPNTNKLHFFTQDSLPEDVAAVAKVMLCKHIPEGSKATCIQQTQRLTTADSIELTYNKSEDTVVVSALWTGNGGHPEGVWDSTITQTNHRMEVGILDERTSIEEDEIAIGGVIAVIGDSSELSETLFTFPAQHYSHPGSFHAHFTLPTNIHPVLNLAIDLPTAPPKPECTLNAYFTTPNFAFVDKYQLSDPQFLASQNLTKLIGPYGDTDLEAPQWTADKWGSEFVLGLNTADLFPADEDSDSDSESTDVESGKEKDIEAATPQGGLLNAKVPLHTRYIAPKTGSDATMPHALPFPAIFWACPASTAAGSTLSTAKNPFKPNTFGFEPYFPQDTTFHHISPAYVLPGAEGGGRNVGEAKLEIPTLGMAAGEIVKVGTVLVVLGCVAGLCVVIWKSVGGKDEVEERKKKQ